MHAGRKQASLVPLEAILSLLKTSRHSELTATPLDCERGRRARESSAEVRPGGLADARVLTMAGL